MSQSGLDKARMRTEAEARAQRACAYHSEAQKYGADGKTLFIVCSNCGATLRQVPPGAYLNGMKEP